MRELELAGMSQALEHSEQNRDETRAARRKYREERRARILQLFVPVRLVSFRSDAPVPGQAGIPSRYERFSQIYTFSCF
jgi:hypothetical protein